ncbi:MAG: class I SAM-dependent methyltransferase [Vallitaleaceae bacterium]|nr:class I SAM-dependent methyltransferase [Vallitaleaceae bacterium]
MAYESFASVYDQMMKDVPYEEWVEYVLKLMNKFHYEPKMILDLGCGTGTMTGLLAKKGYEMIGIDLSEDMLIRAREKARDADLDILYLCQDMTAFELYGTVGCIVSLCDSLNYILEEDALLQVFKLADNYLEPGGLFIFDLNTEYKFKEILSDQNFSQAFEDCAYIWDNYYYEEEAINEYVLTLFVQNQELELYERSEEIHHEKAYSIETVKRLLAEAGLKFEGVYHDNTLLAPKKNSERIYYVAREQKKKEK